MSLFPLKPTSSYVKAYYAALARFHEHGYKVFNNREFLSRNVIAAAIEKVIHSITAKHFSRDTFLKRDRFQT